MEEIIAIKNRQVLPIENGFVEVSLFDKNSELVKGRGYIKGDLVYIYRGKRKKKEPMKPASIYKVNDDYEFIDPSDNDRDKYGIFNLIRLNRDIIQDLDDSELRHIDLSNVKINEGDYFAPDIKPDDDMLKRVIKEILKKRKINIRILKNRFNTDYEMNNMKSALLKDGNMSIKYFQKWCEILEVHITVTAEDISENLPDKYRFKEPVVQYLDYEVK